MAIKDILVHLDHTDRSDRRLEVALNLAKTHGAKLTAFYARANVNVQGLSGRGEDVYLKRIQEKEAEFDAKVAGAGVNVEWKPATYSMSDTAVTDQIIDHALHADLTIVGQHDVENADGSIPSDLAARLVLESGRPLLIIPHSGKIATLGERVMIAWNAGRESARAVNDAIPVLQKAKNVQILALNPDDGDKHHGEIPCADICQHLSEHGIEAKPQHLTAHDIDTGNMLLSCLAEEASDLLVMGAYGQHRFRELVLGGATRDILRNMTVPVLMSH